MHAHIKAFVHLAGIYMHASIKAFEGYFIRWEFMIGEVRVPAILPRPVDVISQ